MRGFGFTATAARVIIMGARFIVMSVGCGITGFRVAATGVGFIAAGVGSPLQVLCEDEEHGERVGRDPPGRGEVVRSVCAVEVNHEIDKVVGIGIDEVVDRGSNKVSGLINMFAVLCYR